MKWIGLTGGIATGKSTVKNKLIELNIPVIDADQISHELTLVDGLGYKLIVDQFGIDILNPDLTLNRKKLGEIVFNHKQKLLQLEQILHPLIQAEVKTRKLFYQNQKQKICFYDVPLLFEKNLVDQFDKIVLVYAPLSIQISRIMQRDGLDHHQTLARIKNQWPMSAKIKRSDYCLDNSTTNEDLNIQIVNLIQQSVSI